MVLFGATGFTGGLAATYLARAAPPGLRWGLAGRSPERLAAVRARLAETDPALAGLPLLTADATEPDSLADVARRTAVVATTVGPYLTHGEPLVAACAEAGTDYADLTGEAEFVDAMFLAHHATALRTGARLVHACGFDSVPHDLGVQLTVERLPEGVPLRVRGMVRSNAAVSGGTLASALAALSRPRQARAASRARRRAQPPPAGRRVTLLAGRPHRDALTGFWLVPLPTIDPHVVARSAWALERYGPDFGYAHYAAARRLPVLLAGSGTAVGLALAARVRPLRALLAAGLPAGRGPGRQRRDRSWFSVTLVGQGGGRTVVVEVSGGDPGYTDTATMLGESALCLALDDNPVTAGQVTTAEAMGHRLRHRLAAAGLSFEVRSETAD